MLGRIYRYDELSNDGGESAIRPAIVFAKHIEMSELCNNSACFSAEIKGTSDICVTFEFYNVLIGLHQQTTKYMESPKNGTLSMVT